MKCVKLWEIEGYESLPVGELLERLYRETAEGGEIVMVDPVADGSEQPPLLLRCVMKWSREDMEQTRLAAERLHRAMEQLAPMRAALLEQEADGGEHQNREEPQAVLLQLWEVFAKPLPTDEQQALLEAERRMKGGRYAYGTVLSHVWLCRLLELEAPTVMLQAAVQRCALSLMAHWDTAAVSYEYGEEVGA